MSIFEKVDLNCEPPIPMKLNWADGMIGATPIFTNKAKAKIYANGAEIIEVKLKQ